MAEFVQDVQNSLSDLCVCFKQGNQVNILHNIQKGSWCLTIPKRKMDSDQNICWTSSNNSKSMTRTDSFLMRRTDQKVNRKNEKWFCTDPTKVLMVIHNKFRSVIWATGAVSYHLIFHRVYAITYIEVLAKWSSPRLTKWLICDNAPFHIIHVIQKWLVK